MAQDVLDSISAPPAAFELFMQFQGRGSSQGGACYGKYLFVGIAGNRTLDVYDLEEKCGLGAISMPGAHPSCHANTLNFGNLFYKVGDEFPLLYVSSGGSFEPGLDIAPVYVYRLQRGMNAKGKTTFQATLVQTIGLSGFHDWAECITDNDASALWVKSTRGNKLIFLKYPVPAPDQRQVLLTPRDTIVQDSIFVDDIPALCHIQGMLCHDGYIYYATGMPGEPHFWAAINLEMHAYEYIVNLYEVDGFDSRTHRGNAWEPEYLFYYQDDYYIGFRPSIYKMNLEPIKRSNYFFNRYRLTH